MVIKDFSSYLLGIVTGVLFSISVVCFVELTRKPSVGNNPYEEIIQQQKDSLTAQIKNLEFRFKATEVEKSALRQKVFVLEQELLRIKKNYEKSIVTVDSYTNPECEQCFTDRYGHK